MRTPAPLTELANVLAAQVEPAKELIGDVPFPRRRVVESVVEPVPPFAADTAPERKLAPMEVLATTPPVPLVESMEFWIPEIVRLVVLAVPKKPVPEAESPVVEAYASCEVEEAKSPVRNQVGVVVALVEVPKVVSRDQGQGFVRVMEPPRETDPPPVRPEPAVTVTEEFWS